MKLQFSISELSSYLDEIFPQVVDQYRIVELQPGFARVAQNVKTENLRPGGTVSGPAIFALIDIGMYILLLAHIGKEPLAVTTNCSIDFLQKPNANEEIIADCKLKIRKYSRFWRGSNKTISRRGFISKILHNIF